MERLEVLSDSLHLFTLLLTNSLESVRRKATRMNTLLSAIFKFCTTNQLFKKISMHCFPTWRLAQKGWHGEQATKSGGRVIGKILNELPLLYVAGRC